MKYRDDQEIMLGDIVELSMLNGKEIAKVVMLGESYLHLELEASFESWVKRDRILDQDSIVVEWVNENPLAHNNPAFAPVGNYIFTGISEDLKLIQRPSNEAIT